MAARNRRKPKHNGKVVPLGITIAVVAVCSAIAFSVAYLVAMNTFNEKVTDLAEKQAMFTKLSQVDSTIRQHYDGEINEEELMNALSSSYAKNVDRDNIIYVPEKDYKEEDYKDYKSFRISDGSYIVIKNSVLK